MWTSSGFRREAKLTWYDADYNAHSMMLDPAFFRMRKPYTRTHLTASDTTPHYNENVKFRSKTKDERPGGYFGTSYAEVVLQGRTSTGWKHVGPVSEPGSRSSTDRAGGSTCPSP